MLAKHDKTTFCSSNPALFPVRCPTQACGQAIRSRRRCKGIRCSICCKAQLHFRRYREAHAQGSLERLREVYYSERLDPFDRNISNGKPGHEPEKSTRKGYQHWPCERNQMHRPIIWERVPFDGDSQFYIGIAVQIHAAQIYEVVSKGQKSADFEMCPQGYPTICPAAYCCWSQRIGELS